MITFIICPIFSTTSGFSIANVLSKQEAETSYSTILNRPPNNWLRHAILFCQNKVFCVVRLEVSTKFTGTSREAVSPSNSNICNIPPNLPLSVMTIDKISYELITKYEEALSHIVLPLLQNPQVQGCVFICKSSNFHLSWQDVYCCTNMQITKSNSVTLHTFEEQPSEFNIIL